MSSTVRSGTPFGEEDLWWGSPVSTLGESSTTLLITIHSGHIFGAQESFSNVKSRVRTDQAWRLEY